MILRENLSYIYKASWVLLFHLLWQRIFTGLELELSERRFVFITRTTKATDSIPQNGSQYPQT